MLGMGIGDPCVRVETGRGCFVVSSPNGPLVVTVQSEAAEVYVEIAGSDAEWLRPYLPALLGLGYQPPVLDQPNQLRRLARKYAGFRLPRSPIVFPSLVRIVLQQLVSFRDARNGWRSLVHRYGQPIEGHDGLWAPPDANVLRRMALFQFIECGILPQHARRILGLTQIAKKLESVWGGGLTEDAAERTCDLLLKQRGVGPWTIGYIRGTVMADSDAVVLGDYGFPKKVAYFFSGEEEADDEQMLRLLEPFRPHRFYVLWLLVKGAKHPPRRGPRRRPLRDRLRPPR